MTLNIHIETAAEKWKNAFPRMKSKIEKAAVAAVLAAKKPAAFKQRDFDLNILLTTDAKIRKLNRDYRGKDKPTNVLSFPQMDMTPSALRGFPAALPVPLGDVVLAWQTVARECKAEGKSLENHTIHLIVHGVLHLWGYDHLNAKDANTMEKLECDILKSLGYPDPYHATEAQNGRFVSHGRRT